MQNWYMLTLVGNDQTTIVARVTQALFLQKCQLGETSMMRLGNNFTIMMMVNTNLEKVELQSLLQATTDELHLNLHIDDIEGKLHQHETPNTRVTVAGADKPGIIAKTTSLLADVGFNILDLESDVGGSIQKPIYILHIEGKSPVEVETLQQSLNKLATEQVDVRVSEIDLVLG